MQLFVYQLSVLTAIQLIIYPRAQVVSVYFTYNHTGCGSVITLTSTPIHGWCLPIGVYDYICVCLFLY